MKYSRVAVVSSFFWLISCGPTDDVVLDSGQSTTDTTDTVTTDTVTTDTVTTETGTTETGTTDTLDLECDERSVAQCLAGTGCVHVNGREIQNQDTEPCVDWSQEPVAKGCMSIEMGCGSALTYAASSEDPSDCWLFTNTCIPTGWSDCDTSMQADDCD
mgnify:CR=1 FL=1